MRRLLGDTLLISALPLGLHAYRIAQRDYISMLFDAPASVERIVAIERLMWLDGTVALIWPLVMIPFAWRVLARESLVHLLWAALAVSLASWHHADWMRQAVVAPSLAEHWAHMMWLIPTGILGLGSLYRQRSWRWSLPASLFTTLTMLLTIGVTTPRLHARTLEPTPTLEATHSESPAELATQLLERGHVRSAYLMAASAYPEHGWAPPCDCKFSFMREHRFREEFLLRTFWSF